MLTSKDAQEHIDHVRQVLEILRMHQLYAKASKCTFMAEEVEYLGHVVSRHGIRVDPAKVKCIKEWPQPQNTTQLRGFLGLSDGHTGEVC